MAARSPLPLTLGYHTCKTGQPALIGKALYDFYAVKLSVPQDSNGLSFRFIAYAVTVFGILLAALLLLLKLRHKPRTNQSVAS